MWADHLILCTIIVYTFLVRPPLPQSIYLVDSNLFTFCIFKFLLSYLSYKLFILLGHNDFLAGKLRTQWSSINKSYIIIKLTSILLPWILSHSTIVSQYRSYEKSNKRIRVFLGSSTSVFFSLYNIATV